MLRVVGGEYKRRTLDQPSLDITRPTKDSTKEGLFNSLGNIYNKSFLDVFSGSGAIGIEAYSRGCVDVTLNDLNKEPYKVILSNLKKLNINDIKVYNLDYLALFKKLSSLNKTYDIVFLDPPYKMEIDLDFINKIKEFSLINDESIIIIETDYEINQNIYDNYDIKRLKYGRSLVFILRSKK